MQAAGPALTLPSSLTELTGMLHRIKLLTSVPGVVARADVVEAETPF